MNHLTIPPHCSMTKRPRQSWTEIYSKTFYVDLRSSRPRSPDRHWAVVSQGIFGTSPASTQLSMLNKLYYNGHIPRLVHL